MDHCARFVSYLVQLPKALIVEGHAVDVAEDHGPAKMQLLEGAAKLNHRGGRIIERKSGERDKAPAFVGDGACKGIVDQSCQAHCGGRFFNVGTRRGEGNDLGVHTGLAQHLFPVINVAMAAHRDVVIARIVQRRIALIVMSNAHGAWPFFDGFNVLRRVVVVVKINEGHSLWLLRVVDVTRQSTREAPGEASPALWRCLADWQRTGSRQSGLKPRQKSPAKRDSHGQETLAGTFPAGAKHKARPPARRRTAIRCRPHG